MKVSLFFRPRWIGEAEEVAETIYHVKKKQLKLERKIIDGLDGSSEPPDFYYKPEIDIHYCVNGMDTGTQAVYERY